MLDYIKIFQESLARKKAHEYYDVVTKEAAFNKAIYTGEGQKDILLKYRTQETKEQKDQRERITRTKTKHICRKIENIFDELKILDKAAVDISSNNADELKAIIYEYNIEPLAFDLVKYYNLIDANAFLVFGLNKYEDLEFKVIPSTMVYDYYIVSGRLKFLMVQVKRDKATDYRLYHPDGIIDFIEGKEKDAAEFVRDGLNTYTVKRSTHGKMYAFQIGWKKNPATEFKTCVSIYEGASELFTSLIWEGSELDVTKACHGIVKTYAYAPRCNNQATIEGSIYPCINGMTGESQCPACKGSGLQIHTSNQDIVYLPEPIPGQDSPFKLSEMVHTEHVSPDILNLRKEDIKELESEIVKTCFNSNFTSKSDVAKTATENLIDLKGMYSALGNLGKQVSECFIWMVECIADSKGFKDVQVNHGYALNLKLEDLDALIGQRSLAVNAGVPMEVIKVIDFAIMKKQHVDNPTYLDQFSVWEKFRPLANMGQSERQSIIAAMPENHPTKVLYIYFSEIKESVLAKYKDDKFYQLSQEEKRKVVDNEVAAMIEKLPSTEVPRIDFNA